VIITNFFQNLDFYDIVVNIAPGAIILLSVFNYIPKDNIPSSILFTGLVLAAYLIGQIIQSVSSTIEKLIGRKDYFGEAMTKVWNGKGDEVDEKFWETAKEKYDLSEDFSDSGDLLRLVLSYLWSEGNSKAIRMQSIYTFHRSMWMTSIFLIVISTGFLVENYMETGAILPLYSGLLILSIFGAWLFYSRKKKFSEKFIQYCITDFYQRET
jgi:hypothetical protein